MEIRAEEHHNTIAISFTGASLDASNSKAFKEECAALLRPGVSVLLDLTGVEFVDSSGLGAILSCFRRVKASGGDLVLCAPSHQVLTLLELVRMDQIFTIYDTRAEALAALS